MAIKPNYIVCIGASAGGLSAYKELLDCLPSDTGMAFVFATHTLPTATSALAEILLKHTQMPITTISTGMAIRANYVYLSAPNTDVLIENYTFKVVSPRTKGNVLIDYLLTSLANAMGTRAIGVVLSGYDGDGTDGCKQIKAKGGITFAQDSSAEVPHMPRSAQAAGYVDFVMPPRKIAEAIVKIAGASPVTST